MSSTAVSLAHKTFVSGLFGLTVCGALYLGYGVANFRARSKEVAKLVEEGKISPEPGIVKKDGHAGAVNNPASVAAAHAALEKSKSS